MTAAPSGKPPAHSPLRTELRRGIAPWTGLAVALTLLVPLWSKAARWQGSWGATQTELHAVAALLGGPLVIAAACWQGGREHRRRIAELLVSVPRSRLAQAMTAATPVALWAAAGYLLALGVVFAATAPYAGAGGPSLSIVATDLGLLLSIGFVGFVVGRLVRWRLIAPVLAAAFYVLLGAPNYLESDIRFLNPAEQYALKGAVPVWWFAPVLLAWTGGIAATVLIAYAARRRLLAVVPLALAVVAGAVIVPTGADLFRENPAVARRVCTAPAAGTPQICVKASDAPVLPSVSEALDGMFSRLEGVPGAPAVYVDTEIGPKGGEAALGAATRGWNLTRNRLTDPRAYASNTALTLVDRDCPDGRRTSEGKRAKRPHLTDDAVRTWLAGDESPWDPEARPLVARLTAMPDADRKTWLGRYLATRKSCTPSEVPAL
ncbi:hypothetical protein OHU11_15350 [Streptomyces sp. NBC_00257]|uniref:hypothetical protein n=1 Tax=unclassified Streptomyces TaxID=2593676 RepID=UPI00224F72C8|nr:MULTISPECIES: hypothetical protein [unclassified Streptomyces]WTB56742.1 hypothetical protein OG832_28070 [Streptomyces sp. NBC_00826]WTH90375.1 hypothetical protein OIC43_15620 [Streptomyces sp. NBC_00825]WTH99102.1 hypothetical protein OHA23_15605 [Streptomyces sp. NBC_00822]MCX4864518.1 hypothetical protein [Streptomyces sp. NBC_00906]MCX4895756.1 hypothetical protein [Streptomyces sp. NBC_00892]